MPIHINDLAPSVAMILKNFSQGVKDGANCGLVVQSNETSLQISGEVVFDGEIIQQTTENVGMNDKILVMKSPKEVSQQGTHSYNEEVQDGGTTSESIGIDQSVDRHFRQGTA